MRSPLIGSHSVFCIWLSSEKDSWAKHRVDDLLSETWERTADSDGLLKMRTALLLLYILYKHIWFTSWSSGNLQVGMLMRLFFLRDNNSLEQKKKLGITPSLFLLFLFILYGASAHYYSSSLSSTSIVHCHCGAHGRGPRDCKSRTNHGPSESNFFSLLRNKKKNLDKMSISIFFFFFININIIHSRVSAVFF